jgi:hypothetical protein
VSPFGLTFSCPDWEFERPSDMRGRKQPMAV